MAEDRLRGRTLPALSERSITSVPALLQDLAQARERGYAVDDEEATAGVLCLAVPVTGFRTDSAPFAISVTVLKARLDDEFRAALLKDLRAIAAGMENPMLPQGASEGGR
ncbi:IclR family transcriptional regulator C-terminal domain-containing protein [Streptomyces stelliscabiei]